MSDPRGPGWSDPTQTGGGYPPYGDPAYGHYPTQQWGPPTYYGPGTQGVDAYGSPMTQPTVQFPAYWQPPGGYPPNQAPPPPPEPPKSPRWLWIAAGAAVLVVSGLVLALVIVSSSSRESKVVAPLPGTTSTTPRRTTTRMPPPLTTTRVPLPTTTTRPLPTQTPSSTAAPATPAVPGETTSPTGTETVVYNVSGEGRAINITYVDSGGVMQTEFNVALPWSKEVSLSAPAKNSASVAVVNVGRDVTCSVSVNGAQVRQRTGQGLTICTGFA